MDNMEQTIRIIRGTTNAVGIQLADATGAPYVLGAGEVLRFGVQSKMITGAETAPIIIKELTSESYDEMTGGYLVTILPEDTENLICQAYCYDVGLQIGSDYFNVIEYSDFVVLPNVTSVEVSGT